MQKQMILMRRDLNMTRGKECSQAAHVSMIALLQNMDHPCVKAWLESSFTKITLSVDSEDELNAIVEKAEEAGIITAKCVDAGRTMFNGQPTLTCAAIGPAESDDLAPITGHLKLR